MEPLKEGDWVRDTRAGMKRPIVQLQPNCIALTDYEKYGKHFIKWIPEPGEWVIPDTGINEDMFVVMKYNGVSLIPDRCEPFIGKLPSNLKG